MQSNNPQTSNGAATSISDPTKTISPNNNNDNDNTKIKRKLRKIEKKSKSKDKLIWLAGHLITIIFGLFYGLYYLQHKSQRYLIPVICYKISLIGIWLSYSMAVYSQYNIKSLPNYRALIATENVQYLGLSVFWFFNRNSLFKLLPYMMISLLHLSSLYNFKPVLKFQNQIVSFIAYDELFLFVLLFVDTLLLRGTSGYGLIIYGMFYWLRILQSENTRFFLYKNLVKLDSSMSKIKNKKVQNTWLAIKKFLTTKQATFEHQYLN